MASVLLVLSGCMIRGTPMQPEHRAIRLSSGMAEITFVAEPDAIYQLQKTTDLIEAEWRNIGPAVKNDGRRRRMALMDPDAGDEKAFYRILMTREDSRD